MNVPNQLNLSIYPLDRDLSKRWFIKFKFRGKEYQRYGKLNHLATVKERMKLARKMCKEIHEEFADKPAPIAARAYKYLEENKEGWRKKTYQSYKSKLDVFFEFLGNREPNNAIIKEFFIGIQKNRHNKTYNGYLVFLKKVFKICGRSPELFEGLSKQKAYSTPARYFQSYQIKRLKKAIQEQDPELLRFVQFMYYCFIRPGELRMMKIGDLLLDDNRIVVRAEISKNKQQQYVAIPAPFVESLEELVINYKPDRYIFPSRRDQSKPASVNNFSQRHRRILYDLGYDNQYKLYSWKHTGAVQAVKAGVGVKELQIQLRHHSLDQVNMYLRQLGVSDLSNLREKFPKL